jgi:hypothetical protein
MLRRLLSSSEHALRVLIPKILPDLRDCFQIHAFDGVPDMLAKLPDRLRGYAGWMPPDWRIVIVRDEDREDCGQLESELVQIVRQAGLSPKPKGRCPRDFQVLTRIAVEELEAWLLEVRKGLGRRATVFETFVSSRFRSALIRFPVGSHRAASA